MDLEHLDQRTRQLMLAEIRDDVAVGRLYVGTQLATAGADAWPGLLLEAAEHHDVRWLTAALSRTHFWVPRVPYRKRDGTLAYRDCPSDAPDKLAEGEFNRFYIRALARRALEDGLALEVVRVKAVAVPRTSSELKIGTRVDPASLLRDLRENPGVDTALGIPAGPNSGLGVRLVALADAASPPRQ